MSKNLELVPKPWNRKNSDKSARTIKSVRKPVNDQRAMIVGTPTFRGLRTVAAMPLLQKTVLGQVLI
ncbi:hypothetical protein LEP1GSC016_2593 [Leptospira borgpetersenii serovar Hardjo-bovis str. Sponselee]|uniref:Uncharacterized protein n=1 Tax=Leptospira borgpetersenii serovar Hardjo-bovis str. Sponselee TaxID=1303729 RepID=M6C4U4_LEPBO|nr:hypothetical protein LBK6_04595 [Leptospira borgpetersenii serovar Hardjo]AMX60894.1 hypothetical protein LBK9_04535 [Leptospira borgpetersenii serovar Hardjo]AMX64137.1 hypothetical protein LBK30_04570 [Leptospira borgpetersenii serovar Hardjo]AMX67378.1 hypothetical protein LBHA_04545 [Leptospira borgpetersenii serovar Hardjo]EMJ83798.1 hypothetical protein LEP1GSC016_2593 [Leptospira borgpetersenii serovar Hardjo-bovis str. Sponselee]